MEPEESTTGKVTNATKILPQSKEKPKEKGNHIFRAAGFMRSEKEVLDCHCFLQHCWRGIGREKRADVSSKAHLDLLSNCISIKWCFLPSPLHSQVFPSVSAVWALHTTSKLVLVEALSKSCCQAEWKKSWFFHFSSPPPFSVRCH